MKQKTRPAAADLVPVNPGDIRNLTLLAELILGALKPEDEDRFAQSAQAAADQGAARGARRTEDRRRRICPAA